MHKFFLSVFAFFAIIGNALADSTFTVAVFSLNDFHGAFVRDDAKHIPGAPAFLETLDSLKKIYPLNVTVSAGDNFGGSYFYQSTRKNCLFPQFFKDCGISISALGNHEFDEGQAKLLDRWQTGVELRPNGWDLQYVGANVRTTPNSDMSVGGTSQPKFCDPWAIRCIALPDGRDFHMAFIGLSTVNTPNQVSSSRVKGLSFSGNYTAVLDSLRQLPTYDEVERANSRILLTHIGTTIQRTRRGCLIMNVPYWDDPDSLNLTTLPDGYYDGVLSGHTHNPVFGHLYHNNTFIAAVQGEWHGMYVSMLQLNVDSATLKVLDVTPRIIRVYPKNTADLSPKAARLQAQITELQKTTLTAAGYPLDLQLTQCTRDLEHDRTVNKYWLSEMGRLVTESYANAYRIATKSADSDITVGISHFQSIRSGFYKGPVSVMDVGEALPFANKLRAFRYTGKQLKAIIEHGYNNKRYGWLQYSGIDVTLDKKGRIKTMTYTTPEGKSIVVKPSTSLVIVADEYIVNGGDGYLPEQFPAKDDVTPCMPSSTDAFILYLQSRESVGE